MRTIWNALSVMAIANLIALASIVAWLVVGGRVDRDRVQRVRETFVETVAEERLRLEQEEAERQATELAAIEEARKKEGSPVPFADAMDMRIQRNADEEQRLERLRKEISLLQAAIAREQRKIDSDLEALEVREKAFAAMREQIRLTEGNKQFRKAVSVLESLDAADAMAAMAEMLRSGDPEQVVAYLNAMQDRKRAAVLTEFIAAGQQQVAAELLERLRTRGSAPLPEQSALGGALSAGP
ncbi:MAG: hypothetical protein KF912_05610 [Phycisphaeraceae bacterium]|nr:hypothetical protein [Phycisphaeraceae bacterium]MBX3366775.1 hypothetical protein [Phycisphaeraceae bacterium]